MTVSCTVPEFELYPSKAMGTICYPDGSGDEIAGLTTTIDKLKAELEESEAGKAAVVVGESVAPIIILIFTGTGLSIFYMYLMSVCAKEMAYCAIITLLVMLFGGGAIMVLGSMGSGPESNKGGAFGGIICILFGCLLLCYLWCYRSSFETAIAITQATADFFKDSKRLIFVSLMFFLISVVTFLIWAVSEFSLLGMNDIERGDGPQDKIIVWNRTAQIIMGINGFFMLWCLGLIEAQNKFIVMVSAATYYFSFRKRNPDDEGSANVSAGFKFAYISNIGSLCYGSFIITLIKVIKALIDSAADSAKKDGDGAAMCIACIA